MIYLLSTQMDFHYTIRAGIGASGLPLLRRAELQGAVCGYVGLPQEIHGTEQYARKGDQAQVSRVGLENRDIYMGI